VTATLILAVVFLGFLAGFHLSPWGIPTLKRLGHGAPPLDLRFGHAPDEAYRLLALYGDAGVAHFRRMLWADLVFPAVYAALFARLGASLAAAGGIAGLWAGLAIAAPIAAALCDYSENVALLRVLAVLPRRRDGMVRVASWFTQGKFVCSALGLIALARCGLAAMA
jgi:hypothetical protein